MFLAQDTARRTSGRAPARLCAGLAFAATIVIAAAALLSPSAAGAGERLTVVELFTSQGCVRCPPADRFLGELAVRDDVLALGFHVDYWDYIGWADPFADPAFARRQKHYLDRLQLPYVYTPQMVVDGIYEGSGIRPKKVLADIDKARAVEQGRVPITLERVDNDRVLVRIPAADTVYRGEADVVLVGFDRRRETRIESGENAGQTLVNHNVVRIVRPVANWTGKALELMLPLPGVGEYAPDHCAVLVQERDQGRIIGAAVVNMRPGQVGD